MQASICKQLGSQTSGAGRPSSAHGAMPTGERTRDKTPLPFHVARFGVKGRGEREKSLPTVEDLGEATDRSVRDPGRILAQGDEQAGGGRCCLEDPKMQAEEPDRTASPRSDRQHPAMIAPCGPTA